MDEPDCTQISSQDFIEKNRKLEAAAVLFPGKEPPVFIG
jgi:hypothetical protein